MQISLLLMEEIAKLFAIMLMGYAVVKAGLMKSSESKKHICSHGLSGYSMRNYRRISGGLYARCKKRTAPGMCGSSSGTCFISDTYRNIKTSITARYD